MAIIQYDSMAAFRDFESWRIHRLFSFPLRLTRGCTGASQPATSIRVTLSSCTDRGFQLQVFASDAELS